MKHEAKEYSIMISPPGLISYEPVERYEEELLNIWIQASNIFASFDFVYENSRITIKTNWREIKDQFKYSIDNPGDLILSVSGTYEYLEELSEFFLIRFLEMMFITMNISVPGSLNLYNTEIKKIEELSNPYWKNWPVSLSSGPFEMFWETHEHSRWPEIDFVPLRKVVDWYKSLDILLTQRASSNIERCFFSFINYCQGNVFSPADFIWIAHSLEALYDTPKEGIAMSLRKRIFLFLDTPDTHGKQLRRKIDDLYALRSAFVHGTMKIARIPFFENLDQELEEYMIRIHDLSDFGIMILLATVQKMINQNAKELVFYEKYETRP